MLNVLPKVLNELTGALVEYQVQPLAAFLITYLAVLCNKKC
ncbi:hypothetical protein V7056_19650 [Bacillus sp. JJ664]